MDSYKSARDTLAKVFPKGFLNRVSSLSPHDTADISALNEASQCVSMLCSALHLIFEMIQLNINSTEAEMKHIKCLDTDSVNLKRDLKSKTVNEDIKRLLSEIGDKRKAHEMAVKRLQATLKEYKAEKEKMGNMAAKLGAFLKKNTSVPFNDPFEEYFRLLIQQTEHVAEITKNSAEIEHVKTLREWLERYTQQKQYIEIGKAKGCTAFKVKGYCQKLFNMKHSGRYIKEMFEREKRVMEDQERHMRTDAQSLSASNQPSTSHGIKGGNQKDHLSSAQDEIKSIASTFKDAASSGTE